ncbi:SDR family NAD(P)-dependent oxidoreductase [Arthrobacter sp. ATA002]|nr:SDR family NAD(P)-dependent oxidoreductase [Arthrobacter sp. ATA002]WAP53180.1 SDR family NAD(P)-dependent oxidoreductase [Arthrobacter sp. ATA002]
MLRRSALRHWCCRTGSLHGRCGRYRLHDCLPADLCPEGKHECTLRLPLPLAGRTAVVTGVSRRQGIGFAVASRLAQMGASLYLAHFSPHDAQQPRGADNVNDVVGGLRAQLADGARLAHGSTDLAAADGAAQVIDAAGSALGHLDILISNHARSGGDGTLAEMTSEKLDAHWQVNTRSTLLLTRSFAEQHDGRPGAGLFG